MVESAVADVVSPAVAAKDPDGFLGEVVLVREDLGRKRRCLPFAFRKLLKLGHESGGGILRRRGVIARVEPRLRCGSRVLWHASGKQLLGLLDHHLANGGVTLQHAEAVLGIVLEQRVRPSGAAAFLVDRIRRGRSGAAPDGGAPGRVGDEHAVAEQLGDKACIGGLGAARAGA